MVSVDTAQALLESVKAFERAMDGPSTDSEMEAACAMRDVALQVLFEAGAVDSLLSKRLSSYQKGEN